MIRSPLRVPLLALALALPLGACESVTNPEDSALRVVMNSRVGAEASASLIAASLVPGEADRGPISLDDIDRIDVAVEQVLILTGDADADLESETASGWKSLKVTAPETINLRDLPGLTALAELDADASVNGPIRAVRLVFGSSRVVFEDGTEADLFIPSGKVTLATPELALEDGVTTLPLTFLQNASVKKIIRTGRGLLMPPVFEVAGSTNADLD